MSDPTPSTRENLYWRWVVFVFAFVAVSFVSGTIYGWPALRKELRNEENSSWSSETALGAAYTAGAWSTQGMRFFVGITRDRYGTRITTTLCLLVTALGAVGVALVQSSTAVLATSLFATGLGSGVQLCVQPVCAHLFPTYAGSVLASLSGAFQVAGLVFLLIALLPMDRKGGFLLYAAIVILFAGLVWIILPSEQDPQPSDPNSCHSPPDPHDTKHEDTTTVAAESRHAVVHGSFPDPIPPCSIQNDNEEVEERTSGEHIHGMLEQGTRSDDSKSNQEDPDQSRPEIDLPAPSTTAARREWINQPTTSSTTLSSNTVLSSSSMSSQIKSWPYVLLLQWFAITITPLQYYVGTIGFQLETKGDESGLYSDLFSIIYASSAILSPAGGYLADKYSLGLAHGVATSLSALSFFVLASPLPLQAQTIGLIAQGIGRMWVFGTYFAHIGIIFGYANFGTLAGLGLLVSAIVSLSQYILIVAAANGRATLVNILCGALLLCQLPYCYGLHRWEYQQRRGRRNGNHCASTSNDQ